MLSKFSYSFGWEQFSQQLDSAPSVGETMFQVNGGEMVASVANVKRTLAQKWIMYTAGRILQHVYGLLCYTCNNS